jgi:diguanylate cyclase (GGDEF)-like protein
VVGTHFTDYYTDEDININSIKLSKRIVQGDKLDPRIVSIYHQNGDINYLEVDSYPIFDDNKEVIEVEGIAKDITEQYTTQLELAYLSNHDALTGLMNRYSLYNQLEYIINDSKRNHKNLSLFYIDLDNFKLVNDTLGHHEGDKFLKEFSKNLTKNLRQNDILARIGGDEFVLVYTDIQPSNNYTLAQKLLKNIDNEIAQKYKRLHISVSIGIASYPKDGETVDELLKSADLAMYAIKQNGKNNFGIY